MVPDNIHTVENGNSSYQVDTKCRMQDGTGMYVQTWVKLGLFLLTERLDTFKCNFRPNLFFPKNQGLSPTCISFGLTCWLASGNTFIKSISCIQLFYVKNIVHFVCSGCSSYSTCIVPRRVWIIKVYHKFNILHICLSQCVYNTKVKKNKNKETIE